MTAKKQTQKKNSVSQQRPPKDLSSKGRLNKRSSTTANARSSKGTAKPASQISSAKASPPRKEKKSDVNGTLAPTGKAKLMPSKRTPKPSQQAKTFTGAPPRKQKKQDRKASPASAGNKKLMRPKTSKQFFALPDTQQETWNRVVHVIAKMRAEGTSLTQASREFGLDPRIVRNRAGSALRKTKGGRYVARKSDKLLRVLVIPSEQGLTEVAVRGSEIASKIAEYNDAVQRYLRTGDASRLKKFRRKKLVNEKGERIKLLTDLAELQKLGSAGVLSFESLYRSAA